MADEQATGLLLGRQVPVSERYAPELLYPIPRAQARDGLGLAGSGAGFEGVDIWHAYELSWLDADSRPVSWVGRFEIPAHSPSLIESKSFKLYLNSLNGERFESEAAARDRICADLSREAGAAVELILFSVEAAELAGRPLPGDCIDHLPARYQPGEPMATTLVNVNEAAGPVQEVHTHLLRSLCPVTGQPDWASVWVAIEGAALETLSLLEYLLAYRNHQEFHEQCVERIFRDILKACSPQALHVQAFYTRRGGLDITPFRSTGGREPLPRMNRQ